MEAIGAYPAGVIDIEELYREGKPDYINLETQFTVAQNTIIAALPFYRIECNALPGSGTCSAMFTACTMASAVEALGMVVPGTASHPAVTAENALTEQKKRDCVDSVRY